MRMLRCLVLLGVMVTVLAPARVDAQPATPAEKASVASHYKDAGLAAQNSGDYDTAIMFFTKAYELVPHPLFLFHMAQAHRLAGRIRQAIALFSEFLAKAPDHPQARVARDQIAELEQLQAKKARLADAARKARPWSGDGEAPPAVGDPDDDDHEGDGTLIVDIRDQAGAALDGGAVIVDGTPRGRLSRGRLIVAGIGRGRHRVAIEANGYRRFDQPVEVHYGEQVALEARLSEDRPPPSADPRLRWKIALGSSAAVVVAGGLFTVYASDKERTARRDFKQMGGQPNQLDSGDCGKSRQQILEELGATSINFDAFQSACRWHTVSQVSLIVGGVGIVGIAVSLIMLTRDDDPPPTRARQSRHSVAVAPLLAPGSAGASFSVTW
ncbi:MAG TPA: tetratricopeptide repeat protein [Kofleriaceae bacterium]|nr:tetratricopeptide repeat protein [Kofleriaceae bacterium]